MKDDTTPACVPDIEAAAARLREALAATPGADIGKLVAACCNACDAWRGLVALFSRVGRGEAPRDLLGPVPDGLAVFPADPYKVAAAQAWRVAVARGRQLLAWLDAGLVGAGAADPVGAVAGHVLVAEALNDLDRAGVPRVPVHRTVTRWIESGEVPGSKVGDRWLVCPHALLAHVTRRR